MADNRPSAMVQSHRPDGLFGRATARRRWLRPVIWATAVVAGAAVLVGVALTVTASPPTACTGAPTTLTVVASTSQFSVLDGLARAGLLARHGRRALCRGHRGAQGVQR